MADFITMANLVTNETQCGVKRPVVGFIVRESLERHNCGDRYKHKVSVRNVRYVADGNNYED